MGFLAFSIVKSCQAESRGHLLTLSALLGRSSLGLDQLLRSIGIGNKFTLADVLSGSRCPHLVGEGAALAFGMLVMTGRVQTRVEFAGGLDVCELASFRLAVGSIATDRHAGVLEVAMGVGTIGEESAHGLGLVGRSHRR